MFLKTKIMKSTENFFVKTQNTKSIQKKQDLNGCKYIGKLQRLAEAVNNADTVIIGAGAGLSTSAGFTYSGERFEKYFADFEKKYDFHDMYSGGFYPYDTLEEYWAYWSRYIYINRYMDAPKPVYDNILKLVKDKDYFVLTANVDHCFQKAGFDKKRLFYTQGDYGLFQCQKPCHDKTYNNEKIVKKMVESQGYVIQPDKTLFVPNGTKLKMKIDSGLIPVCDQCQSPLTMNLRADGTFVEDRGWREASERYNLFLHRHDGMKIVFLELGVSFNTPGIIKYPFWQMTAANPAAVYACINFKDAVCPHEIEKQSVCIEADADEVVENLVNELINDIL